MERLTFGLETEYAVTCNWGGQRRLPPQEVAQRVVSPGRGGGVVLSNGARLYLGSSGRPVYATPECGSLLDLVAHDKAGERILEGLLPDAGRRLSEEGCAGQIRLLKHNNDFEWGTYVCYEHYLTGLRGEFGRLAGLLIPFLVTRQIICGAGKVQRTPRAVVYSISQRAEHIWEGVAPDGPRSQAIISTRGEPHAGAERFRRLLVTVGDSNMNETATLLKVGATGLVLQMIEAGTVMRDLSLENPIRAIRVISHDITGQRRVRLTNGQEVCALDIQREYLSKARDFTASDGADPISGRVLDLWERALDAIAAQNLDAIARQIDWVTKFRFIDSYRARHGLPLSSPQVAGLDVAYHDVHRGRSLYYQLQRDGAVDRAVRDIDIFEAKTIPPAPSRQTGL